MSDIGGEATSDEGAYQTCPALGKPPPPMLGMDLDPTNSGFQSAIVEIVIEPRHPLGEVAVDAAPTELHGQPARTPPPIDRPKLDESLGEAFVVEEIELIEPFEGL